MPPTVQVDGTEAGHAIAAQAEVLEDPGGGLDLADVRAAASGWFRSTSTTLVFGYSRSAYWVRWHLENRTARPLDLILDLGNSRQDYVRWQVLRHGGASVARFDSGDRLPYRDRLVPTARNFVLPLDMSGHERLDVYVRVATHDGLHEVMPVRLYTRNAFLAHEDQQSLLLSLYHGGLLSLALYNLLLFLATRQRSFGLYVGYIFSLLLWNLTTSGYSFEYLWPNAPVLDNEMLAITAGASFGIFGLFAVEYLQLRHSVSRWLLRTNQTLAWLNLAVVIPAVAGLHAASAAMGQITGIALAVTSLATGAWLLRKGQRQARFFLAAFAMLGAGATAYILQLVGAAPANVLTTWGLQAGSAIEALVLALGLADAMNTLKSEKLQAERRARDAQVNLNTRLEKLVEERTRALEDANRRLHTLAVTDELTGTFNRRHFNRLCDAALARGARDEPLALCMFDLDNFKSYNDRYGHQAGDDTLRTVAMAIQGALRRSGDALFRLGGEEFAVLFTARSPELAYAFVEDLRSVVAALRIPHEGNPGGVVTASFGICWWHPDTTRSADEVYMQADRQLYAAKAGGRNLVRMEPAG